MANFGSVYSTFFGPESHRDTDEWTGCFVKYLTFVVEFCVVNDDLNLHGFVTGKSHVRIEEDGRTSGNGNTEVTRVYGRRHADRLKRIMMRNI